MPKPKGQYNAQGHWIPQVHDHKWVQYTVTTMCGVTRDKPITGVIVHWRCERPKCEEWVTRKYSFRKPSANVTPNATTPIYDEFFSIAKKVKKNVSEMFTTHSA